MSPTKWASKKWLLAWTPKEPESFSFRRGAKVNKKCLFLTSPHKHNTNYYKTAIEIVFAHIFQNGSSSPIEVAPHEKQARALLEGAKALPKEPELNIWIMYSVL